jgi:hypothetical protein
MNYTILFLEHERVTRSTSWSIGLDAAMSYARDRLGERETEYVEVWDDADRLIFRYPASPPG